MNFPDSKFWKNKSVLVTGHTGFKGSWLCNWLLRWNANVSGLSLNSPSKTNHYDLLGLKLGHEKIDIRCYESVENVLRKQTPEIVFHLAAQPLVRAGYSYPIKTYETNFMGTANILEACRCIDSVKSIVVITSDKCYLNNNDGVPFVESSELGGNDPYSNSKACCESLVETYRKLFGDKVRLATCRSGNVVGGGDWGHERLMSDIVQSSLNGAPLSIRNPQATRPWLHVLDALSGYILVAESLHKNTIGADGPWNFSPLEKSTPITVEGVIEMAAKHWTRINYHKANGDNDMPESTYLQLDSTKANQQLGWKNVFTSTEAIHEAIKWYKDFYNCNKVVTSDQLDTFLSKKTANA